jgi:hypothetical protein
MNYWWVNQNQTYKHEIGGGYMWSPKTKKDGSRNTFYDNMTKVKPGDIVFSFFGTKIQYLGIISSHGYSQPKPDFGQASDLWDQDGWMVNVDYRSVRNKIRPKDHINEIRSYLPDKYSPLQKTGDGNQGVYLTHIDKELAVKLLDLIGEDANPAIAEGKEHVGEVKSDAEAEQERIEKIIKKDPSISTTEKETIVQARIGQGKFRDGVLALHIRCPFTGVEDSRFLRAGHLKPWSKCESNAERVDPLNGLALTPVADLLLDQGLVSFDESGAAIFSPKLKTNDLKSMGIDPVRKYKIQIINDDHYKYIEYHRKRVFKKS